MTTSTIDKAMTVDLSSIIYYIFNVNCMLLPAEANSLLIRERKREIKVRSCLVTKLFCYLRESERARVGIAESENNRIGWKKELLFEINLVK